MAYGMGNNQPIIILKEGTERSKNKDAQYNNIAAARAVAEAVRSTLGPKGMAKMLVDSLGDVVITNDGVTILKEIDVQHPAAKMVVEVAKTQDNECGDGTTTSVILAGELLKKAESLIENNIHRLREHLIIGGQLIKGVRKRPVKRLDDRLLVLGVLGVRRFIGGLGVNVNKVIAGGLFGQTQPTAQVLFRIRHLSHRLIPYA